MDWVHTIDTVQISNSLKVNNNNTWHHLYPHLVKNPENVLASSVHLTSSNPAGKLGAEVRAEWHGVREQVECGVLSQACGVPPSVHTHLSSTNLGMRQTREHSSSLHTTTLHKKHNTLLKTSPIQNTHTLTSCSRKPRPSRSLSEVRRENRTVLFINAATRY